MSIKGYTQYSSINQSKNKFKILQELMMKISALIKGLSVATVLLVAGCPAYGASIYINPPVVQLPNDPIPAIVGRPGDVVTWTGFIDTSGLTANLETFDMYGVWDSNQIADFSFEGADADSLREYWPIFSVDSVKDPDTGLVTIIGLRGGRPGFPPNTIRTLVEKIIITLGPNINNDGKVAFEIGVLSAIDVNGKDVTDQFGSPLPEQGVLRFQIRPSAVPETSTIFGLVLAGGFGAFLRKQKTKGHFFT
ncbi:PEP-CTERM sorting domain-containing protein [Nostoc sp. UHCC 0702]|nr:PEP-CTERM sorting domain-containing protein [Nostoc sp. UHCC 0702]